MGRRIIVGLLAFIAFGALLLLHAPVAESAGEPAYVSWPTGPVLDQGSRPQCVAYALEGLLQASPYAYSARQVPSPYWIYTAAQARDGWNDRPHDGTSIEAGFSYLQERAYVGGVTYTHDPQTTADYILTTGPVVLSTFWSTSMDIPDATGVITPNAFIRGYHAFLCNAYDRINEMFGCQNSWGTSFADGGHFKISLDNMAVLLLNDLGEGNREAALPYKDSVTWLQKQLGNH